MAGIRDIKRNGRRRVHAKAGLPALYIDSVGATPVECWVRVHLKSSALGALNHSGLGSGAGAFAEVEEQQPKIIFDLTEVTRPTRGGIVSVEAGEAYLVDHTLEPDDQYITAVVTQLSSAKAAGLPTP